MQINDFFENLDILPQFLKNELESDDWFKIQGKLIDILESQISDSNINLGDKISVSGKVYVGQNVEIADFVVIQGPVYIGDNVQIFPHTHIRPGSIILNDCKIGTSAVVKNSVMMKGSAISDYCYLGDSILGYESRLGAYAGTLNRNFDQAKIKLKLKNQEIVTDLEKYGLILGDKSRIGGGSKTLPGSMISKRSFIYPGAILGGFIGPESYVKGKVDYEIKHNKLADDLK